MAMNHNLPLRFVEEGSRPTSNVSSFEESITSLPRPKYTAPNRTHSGPISHTARAIVAEHVTIRAASICARRTGKESAFSASLRKPPNQRLQLTAAVGGVRGVQPPAGGWG